MAEGNMKLALWQQRLADGEGEWKKQVDKMNHREAVYNGTQKLTPIVEGDEGETTPTCRRNIVNENIESEINSSIPACKVTPKHPENARKAAMIEHLIRNVMDELPSEEQNDLAERTTYIQGGQLYLVEWDNTKRSHNTTGQAKITLIHPKQLVPQPGIYTSIEDMDWYIIKLPTTKNAVKRLYGVDLAEEGESEPEIRSNGDAPTSDQNLTQYIGYERDEAGRINRFSWVNQTVLEDLDNYQARRVPVCARCGRIQPLKGQLIQARAAVEEMPYTEKDAERQAAGQLLAASIARQGEGENVLESIDIIDEEPEHYDGGPCPFCGSTEWRDEEDEYELVYFPIAQEDGGTIPGMEAGISTQGTAGLRPTKVPFYRPDRYPLILRRNVSAFGQLLGGSDVDLIETQQNTTNRLEQKIAERILGAGSIITLPDEGGVRIDPKDHKKLYVSDMAKKQLIDLYEFKGDLQYEMMHLNQVYEESRQLLGITNSLQGRPDSTATSGKAKEYSAMQAAGRQESKRVMKGAAYSSIYELIFQYYLAYADEPRPITYKGPDGETVYEEFSRYDFLQQDEDGVWFYDDEYLFSVDQSATLAGNREAMWQENRMNFESGAYGDPTDVDTQILFWTRMEDLQYPGAFQVKTILERKREKDQQMAQQMAQMQADAAAQANASAMMEAQAQEQEQAMAQEQAAAQQMGGGNMM